MLNVLLIGFDKSVEMPEYVKALWYRESTTELTAKETLYFLDKLVDKAHLTVVNLDRSVLPISEAMALQMSYTKSTPIFGLGEGLSNKFVDELLTDCFGLESLREHLSNYTILGV